MQNKLTFRIEHSRTGSLSILPLVDDTPMSDLVTEFEIAHGYESAGGYGGLVLANFNFGPLDRYFLGQAALPYWMELGGIYLLGCGSCGEVDCWPLVCSVVPSERDVTWNGFRQLHRPSRDYSGFGPFVFDRREYVAAVEMISAVGTGTTEF